MNSISKFKNKVIIAIFCGGLATVFGLNLILPDKAFSESENRILSGSPTFSMEKLKNGDFGRAVDEYISDQFIGRDAWIGVKWYVDQVVGRKETNGIYVANIDTQSGHYKGLIPKLEVTSLNKNMDRNIAAVSGLANNMDIPVYVALIPTAAEIWEENLPYGAPNQDQEKMISQIYDKILTSTDKATGGTNIDVYTILNQRKDEDIYYRTDHHWTVDGALYGYKAIMGAIDVPMIDIPESELIYVQNKEAGAALFAGTSQSKTGARDIDLDRIKFWTGTKAQVFVDKGKGLEPWDMYDQQAVEKKDKYEFFLGGNYPLVLTKYTKAPSKEKIIVIKDSFANSMIPFLGNTFAEVHVIDPRFNKKSISEYARENGIDKIVIMYGVQNFISDSNIATLR